ncbi:MAG: hypothetical protein IKZ71_04160 [Bacteroidales bacterium]|jgi:hypothetical protein|nr:hypothetical protein [Bacteroidales bacterium]
MAVIARNKAVGIGITDAAAMLLVFLVPALSHLTSVPFYLLDPMRMAVLGALLCTRNWKNSLALALALPIVSFALSGHPVFPKFLLISAELSVNVLVFAWLSRKMNAGVSAFVSILLSKLFYYGLKAVVLSAGLLQMSLVSTTIWWQFGVAVALSAAFAIFWNRR